eukprot:PITA_24938
MVKRRADARQMAIMIKQIIHIILLIVSVCILTPLTASDRYNNFVVEFCENSEYTNGSAFQSNLNQVLDSLVENVSTIGYDTTTVAERQKSDSTVYGVAQCRGDLNSSDCKQCLETARSTIISDTNGCSKTSASIILDGCFLRYDNQSFSNNFSQSAEMHVGCNPRENSQPEFTITIRALLLNILYKAAKSPKLFAAEQTVPPYNSTYHIYTLAQCWADLSTEECEACLQFALSQIYYNCTAGALGSQFASVNCYLRSELYPFFNTLILSQSQSPSPTPQETPPESEARRPPALRITLGVVAAIAGLIAATSLCRWKSSSLREHLESLSRTGGDKGEISLSMSTANPELIFKYDTLRKATSNFNAEKKLGEGGFGSVHKGGLPDGRQVAVKRLKIGSSQGDVEFLNEINLINVKKRHLLSWRQRYEIIVGTARGLAYLHEESDIRIIHRDIKASNVLLDHQHKHKITDFGLAKLFADDKTHVSTRVAGTFGYMSPEYAYRGQLTEKADVFSFGVLVLEIISGIKNQSLPQDTEFLIERAWRLYNAERALEIMDSTFEGSYSCEEGIRVIKIGLLCTQAAPSLRPSMSRVVSMLTSEREYLPSPATPAFIDLDRVGAPLSFIDLDIVGAPASHKTSGGTATSSSTYSDVDSSAVDLHQGR